MKIFLVLVIICIKVFLNEKKIFVILKNNMNLNK